ncbi:hypothetical protein ACSVDA_10995 [Cytobacillus sp. Hm23]
MLLCPNGHKWRTITRNFVYKKINCPVCKKEESKKRWNLFINNSKFEALTEYVNSNTYVLVRCTVCDKESWKIPKKLYSGYRDCSRCRKKDSKTAAENFYQKLTTDNLTPLDEYVNMKQFVTVKHNTCQTIFRIIPRSYMYGYRKNKCPLCTKKVKIIINQVKSGQLNVEDAIQIIEKNNWSTNLNELRRFLYGSTTNN